MTVTYPGPRRGQYPDRVQSGVYIDQTNGDIYAPSNDTVDTLVVFPHGANGDAKPKRALHTPHGTFGIAMHEGRNEMFLTTQHDSSVVVFRKGADKDEEPIRLLQGDDTGLADPHGIAIDPKTGVFFVANYGSRALRDPERDTRSGVPGAGKGRDKENWPYGREYAVPGSGWHQEPSISVHAGRPAVMTRRSGRSRARRRSSIGRPALPSTRNGVRSSSPMTWARRFSCSTPTRAATWRPNAC